MGVWGMNPRNTYVGWGGRELWVEGKQVQKEEGRGADGTFVHRKAFIPLVILSPSVFEHLLCVISYVRCWMFKEGKQRDGPCKGLECSGEMLVPREAMGGAWQSGGWACMGMQAGVVMCSGGGCARWRGPP